MTSGRHGFAIVLGLLGASCADYGTGEPAVPRPPPVLPPRPAVDPATCIEPDPTAAWQAEVSRRLDAKLATLAACSAKLDSPGRIGVWLSVDSPPKATVSVWRSEVRKCEVTACLRRELTALELPPTDDHTAGYDAVLELSPRAPPRQVPQASVDWQQEANYCTEPEIEAATGRLPPEEIQRIVRTHYGVFRTCYEAGLLNNPRLGGRISIGFVIARDGRVRRPHVVDSTLPDCTVSACVRRRFEDLAFPPPEGGVVTVIYPIMLEPG